MNTTKTYVTNGKVLAIFAQGKVNGRTQRFILYYNAITSELLQKKKVSKKDGNSAFKKLLGMGYKKFKVEVA